MAKIRPIQPVDSSKLREVEQYRESSGPIQVSTSPSTGVSSKPNVGLANKQNTINPFLSSNIGQEHFDPLRNSSSDQITWELTQLYVTIEEMASKDNSMELQDGLKALEDEIRLLEYLYKGKTAIAMD